MKNLAKYLLAAASMIVLCIAGPANGGLKKGSDNDQSGYDVIDPEARGSNNGSPSATRVARGSNNGGKGSIA